MSDITLIPIIAISADIEALRNEQMLDPEVAKHFPGVLWVHALAQELRSSEIRITTADFALQQIHKNKWKADQISVIQHLDDPETETLIKLGAHPLIITVLESPLYVPYFYKNIDIIAPKFTHRIMFGGCFNLFNAQNGYNHFLRFPIFNSSDIKKPTPWKDRDFMVMVVANKYDKSFSDLDFLNPTDIIKWAVKHLKSLLRDKFRSTFLYSNTKFGEQLLNLRLDLILYFMQQNRLSLFGSGWHKLNILPKQYQKKLAPYIKNTHPIIDKQEEISRYKFAICFENFSFPGYVTEKIIDCLVAGVIPIYWGAPDIEKYVPLNTFINAKHYQNFDELLKKLDTITEQEANEMIKNGREFLLSPTGKLHSYEGFASFIKTLILE